MKIPPPRSMPCRCRQQDEGFWSSVSVLRMYVDASHHGERTAWAWIPPRPRPRHAQPRWLHWNGMEWDECQTTVWFLQSPILSHPIISVLHTTPYNKYSHIRSTLLRYIAHPGITTPIPSASPDFDIGSTKRLTSLVSPTSRAPVEGHCGRCQIRLG